MLIRLNTGTGLRSSTFTCCRNRLRVLKATNKVRDQCRATDGNKWFCKICWLNSESNFVSDCGLEWSLPILTHLSAFLFRLLPINNISCFSILPNKSTMHIMKNYKWVQEKDVRLTSSRGEITHTMTFFFFFLNVKWQKEAKSGRRVSERKG